MSERSRTRERIEAGQEAVRNGVIPSVRERRKILRRMLILLVSHREAAYSVLAGDLGRSRQGAIVSEMLPLIRTIKYLIRKLPALVAARRTSTAWINLPGKVYNQPRPYGHVLIAGSWNFPLLQALEAVAGAYAAGNRVVVKLPERASKSAQFIRWLIEETFVGDEVITVDREYSLEELLEIEFDYIFSVCDFEQACFIRRKTALFHTVCDFITGGRSVAIVDEKAVVETAARRIVQGKFFNAGQSRIAPDIVLVHSHARESFKMAIDRVCRHKFGTDVLEHPETGKIIDSASYERLSKLSENGRLICGGEKSPEELKIAPTVIDMLSGDDPLLTQEIAGPILPVAGFSSEEDLICKLKRFGHIPAVYYFGKNRNIRRRLIGEIHSDSLVVNDAVMQFFNRRFPGKDVFNQFTRIKSVMLRPARPDLPWRYLPVGKVLNWILENMVKWSI